jgi:hypothetical protein
MDLGDITQLVLVATSALVLGRVGLALARLIERRSSSPVSFSGAAEERLRALEDETLALRQDLTELQERQDFTERALVRDPGQPHLPPRGTTPEVTPR